MSIHRYVIFESGFRKSDERGNAQHDSGGGKRTGKHSLGWDRASHIWHWTVLCENLFGALMLYLIFVGKNVIRMWWFRCLKIDQRLALTEPRNLILISNHVIGNDMILTLFVHFLSSIEIEAMLIHHFELEPDICHIILSYSNAFLPYHSCHSCMQRSIRLGGFGVITNSGEHSNASAPTYNKARNDAAAEYKCSDENGTSSGLHSETQSIPLDDSSGFNGGILELSDYFIGAESSLPDCDYRSKKELIADLFDALEVKAHNTVLCHDSPAQKHSHDHDSRGNSDWLSEKCDSMLCCCSLNCCTVDLIVAVADSNRNHFNDQYRDTPKRKRRSKKDNNDDNTDDCKCPFCKVR